MSDKDIIEPGTLLYSPYEDTVGWVVQKSGVQDMYDVEWSSGKRILMYENVVHTYIRNAKNVTDE
jgi:hypothetical protein